MPRALVRVVVGTIVILVTAVNIAIYFEALQPLSLRIASAGIVTKNESSGNGTADGRTTTNSLRQAIVVDAVVEKQKQYSRPEANEVSNSSTNTSIEENNGSLSVQESAGVPRNHSIADEAAADQFNETSTVATAATPSLGSNGPHVISWIGVPALDTVINRYWKGNLFCEEIQAARQQQNNSRLHIAVNISFSCQELYSTSDLGSGNFLSALFHMRMSALALGNVDMHVICPDADRIKSQLVLPWFMGNYWSSEHPSQQPTENHRMWSVESTCGNYDTSPISHMYQRMQYALRRMAIGLVGLPVKDPSHPAHKWAEEYLWSPNNNVPDSDLQLPLPQKDDNPPFPAESLELDDATIHFRCGDLMLLKHPSFGFMKFSGYTKYISPDARSIGILTQPFGTEEQGRRHDQGALKRERCRIVVTSLVDYIRERFPHSRVTIHNGPNETIALAYARMILANQTIVGISSFGVFAAIGTFGTGYIRRPDFRRAPNKFLVQPPLDQMADNVVLIEEPNRIMCAQISKLWQTAGANGVLNWFWNDTVSA